MQRDLLHLRSRLSEQRRLCRNGTYGLRDVLGASKWSSGTPEARTDADLTFAKTIYKVTNSSERETRPAYRRNQDDPGAVPARWPCARCPHRCSRPYPARVHEEVDGYVSGCPDSVISTNTMAEWELALPFTMMMEPGAIGVLSYAHHSIDEPALLIGMAFPSTE